MTNDVGFYETSNLFRSKGGTWCRFNPLTEITNSHHNVFIAIGPLMDDLIDYVNLHMENGHDEVSMHSYNGGMYWIGAYFWYFSHFWAKQKHPVTLWSSNGLVFISSCIREISSWGFHNPPHGFLHRELCLLSVYTSQVNALSGLLVKYVLILNKLLG